MNKFNPFESLLTFMKREFTTFDMSNFHQTSCKLGRLNVNRVDLVMPSDYWKGSTSLAIKVAPLIAPAFTRIKALINSFYVSYPQVWNYWNQFISNRPSDVYANSTNSAKYAGRYVEPFIPMQFIALICKIAVGNAHIEYDSAKDLVYIDYIASSRCTHIKFELLNGVRLFTLTLRNALPSTDPDYLSSLPSRDTYLGNLDVTVGRSINYSTAFNGFANKLSFFYHLIKECYENLKSFGIPCDLVAKTDLEVYEMHSLNALPFFCYSKIWQDYFRNSQIQGSEFDYRESNGILARAFYAGTGSTPTFVPDSVQSSVYGGWRLRIADLPPSGYSSVSSFIGFLTYYHPSATSSYRVGYDYSEVFALLIGYGLHDHVVATLSGSTNQTVIQVPQYYNGLLLPKYRNFENDVFTSAAVDPMNGAVSLAVPSTIEELRSQSKLEEFLERNTAARNFYDFLQSHFGTHAESVANQRCKLLGTQSVNVNISEQLQTSESSVNSPLGSRAGVAEGFGSTYTVSNNFQEHGCIITTLSFVIDSQYFQGLPEIFEHHKDYLSYPWPEFANLGLEAIPTSLLFFGKPSYPLRYSNQDNISVANKVSGSTNDYPNDVDLSSDFGQFSNGVFGYTPRYSVHKFKLDQLSGEFTNSLDFWNTFREFFSCPRLCHAFISYENAVFMSNLNRIFAVDDELADKFYVDMYNDYSVSRCLPLVANPTLD